MPQQRGYEASNDGLGEGRGMSNIDKQALRQLAVDAKELAIIKRYTKGIEAQKKFIAVMTPDTGLALLDELEAKDRQIAYLQEY